MIILNFIFYIFIIAALVQLGFWIFVFSKLAFHKSTPITEKKEPVSIVICARNEAKNLEQNLYHILNQNYHSFEVIVVNDQSDDNSEEILINYKKKYTNFAFINVIAKKSKGKKEALAKGIEAARYDLLLLTDADCVPASPDWIQTMQSRMQANNQIGLGYGPYYFKKGFLNTLIRYETVYTAIQYFSFALLGLPYMGVGRNLMYRKHLFQKIGGFDKHQHVASGDDDLFINAAAMDKNTICILDKPTFVYSEPKTDWYSYFHQKSRHYTTSIHYRWIHKIMLGLLVLSHFFFIFGGLFLIINEISTVFVLLLFIIRTMVLLILYQRILKKFEETSLLWWIPLLDALMPLYYVAFSHALFQHNNKWK